MANDLLPIEDGSKYMYEFANSLGKMEEKEVIIDEKDLIWRESRHYHMAELLQRLSDDFNRLVSSNKALLLKGKKADISDMKDMLAELPEFQEMKSKYSLHISMAQECMNIFGRKNLQVIGMIEQDMATGESATGESLKQVFADLVPLLDHPSVEIDDKLRLLILYIFYKGGLKSDSKKRIYEICNFDRWDKEVIENLEYFGKKLQKEKLGNREKVMKKLQQIKLGLKKPDHEEAEEESYELSRYVTLVKKLLQGHVKGQVEKESFPYTREATSLHDRMKRNSSFHPPTSSSSLGSEEKQSLRSAKANWNKAQSQQQTRPPVTVGKTVIFVAGGLTYSEIRTAYEISNAHNHDVLIGSTHIVTPKSFLSDMRRLRYGPPEPPPPVVSAVLLDNKHDDAESIHSEGPTKSKKEKGFAKKMVGISSRLGKKLEKITGGK